MSAPGPAGRRQTWTADTYERNARFVSDLGSEILSWLDAKPGERILDLGCGDGALTVRIVEAGAETTGVDTSAGLLAAARGRGLDVRHMDGEALAFDGDFDAVFSNAALHWMQDPDAVIAGVAKALKAGGRFVAEFGGHGNVAAIVSAMRAVGAAHGGDLALAGPWYFPTPDAHAARLEAGGFSVERIALVPRPTRLPGEMADWLVTFRKPFFDQFQGETRGRVIAEVTDALAPNLRDEKGQWIADYVRLRFAARLP